MGETDVINSSVRNQKHLRLRLYKFHHTFIANFELCNN